jgi:hypothetical protein
MGKLVNIEQRNELLINAGNDNNWIRVALVGIKSGRNAYGARVRLVSGDLEQYREHTSAHGYNSANDPRLLFGLGQNDTVDLIEVTWPSGVMQTVGGVAPGQTITVTENAGP